MPHRRPGPDRSTLDTVGEWFTLLTPDPASWVQPPAAPWPLRIEALADEHAPLLGLGAHGALLVRPDGHIAARWCDHPSGESPAEHALASVTGPSAG